MDSYTRLSPEQIHKILKVFMLVMPYAALAMLILVLYLCCNRDISR